ncbi:MAG TPA: MFS transporter [Dictyobacter sp.]|jgi:MFS family permease|nr:MFS transporter [Dictyobacter sp.]
MARRSILFLLIGTCLQRANSGAGNVVLGLLLVQLASKTSHSITSVQVGLLPVAFYSAELLLAPLMGSLSDHWGRRKFLLIGPLCGFGQMVLLFFVPHHQPFSYLLLLQVGAGVCGAMTTPATLGFLADITVQSQAGRTRVMSFYELMTSGGIAVGTVLGGIAWDRLGRLSFFLLAISYVLVSGCMALIPAVHQVVSRENVRVTLLRYGRIVRMPRLFIFLPAWLCISALIGIWLSSQITFLLSRPSHNAHQLLMGIASGHGGGERLSLMLGTYVLFFGLCLLFWAFFLNKVPRLQLMLTSVVGVYIACVALFGINHHDVAHEQILYLWLPILLIGIFAETSFAPAALAYLADVSEYAAKDRGLVMGLYSIFLGLGQILGNGLGGVFARQFGFDGLIYLTALLAFIAFISLLWLFREERKPVSFPA